MKRINAAAWNAGAATSIPAGHGNLPRFQVEQATLEWFDQYLGRPAKK